MTPSKDERKLLNEDPLLVLPSLAKVLGLNGAIIVQQIHYWLTINEGKESNFKDGYYWTFNSSGGWQKQFPFWSKKTIERALRKVEDKGIVVTGCYNKRSFDRTKWYRLDYAKLIEACPLDHNGQIQWTKKVQPLHQNDLMGEATHCNKMTSTIPETNITENTTEIKGTIKKKDTTVIEDIPLEDTGNTPLMENRNHPSGKSQATRGLTSLTDKDTENEPIPRSPLPFEGSPKSQEDSVESHPTAPQTKVKPVSVFSPGSRKPSPFMAADPTTTDRRKRILGLEDMKDVLYILESAEGRPASLKGDLETILESPDDDTLKAIKAWLDKVLKQRGES